MAKNRIGRHGLHGAVAVVTVCGLAVACSGIPADPAPVFMKGGAPGIAAAGPEPAFPVSRQITSMPRPAAAMPRETRQVTVQRGMSVGSLAGEYHVSKQAIIAANHLEPPYKIKLGFPLIIPGTAAPPVQQQRAVRQRTHAFLVVGDEHRGRGDEQCAGHARDGRRGD